MNLNLSIENIRTIFGPAVYERGMEYYTQNMIHSAVLMESGLKARCHGSMGYSYFLDVTCEPSPNGTTTIKSVKCSCPQRGYCKHIAALLLTWHHKPDIFKKQDDLATFLGKQTKEDLVALIFKLCEKDAKLLEQLFKLSEKKVVKRRGARKSV